MRSRLERSGIEVSRIAGAHLVRYGGTNATSFTVNSATSITATAPAGSGTVDVTVTTVGETSATSAADQIHGYCRALHWNVRANAAACLCER